MTTTDGTEPAVADFLARRQGVTGRERVDLAWSRQDGRSRALVG